MTCIIPSTTPSVNGIFKCAILLSDSGTASVKVSYRVVVVDVDVLVAEDEDTIGSVVVVVGGGIWEAVAPIVVAAVISLIITRSSSVDENCECVLCGRTTGNSVGGGAVVDAAADAVLVELVVIHTSSTFIRFVSSVVVGRDGGFIFISVSLTTDGGVGCCCTL